MNPFSHALLVNFNDDIRDVTAIGETLAYTWFGRPNYAYSEEAGKYWIGSTKDTPEGTTQHITEYDIATDIYTTTKVGTAHEKDDHNQAQILIRHSDNRLIAFYSEHIGAAIRYRISTNPFDSTSWQNEITLDPLEGYSYISPYQASNGNIFLLYRTLSAGVFKWWFLRSTDDGVTFGSAVEFYYDASNKSYLITCQDGDKIHFAASDGHPQSDPTKNVGVYHFYFDLLTETAHRSDTTVISLPLNAAALTPVAQMTGTDTSWILDISVKEGNPRILYVKYLEGHSNDLLNKDLYFVKYDGNSWVNNTLIARTLSGYMEDDGSIQEYGYSPASRFDTSNPDIIWMPKEVNGILEIHKVDLSVNPFFIEQITFDSEVDNWRPISIPSPVNNLLWLKNNDYNYYTDYSISLQTKTVQV